jgi:hypothetical protein
MALKMDFEVSRKIPLRHNRHIAICVILVLVASILSSRFGLGLCCLLDLPLSLTIDFSAE